MYNLDVDTHHKYKSQIYREGTIIYESFATSRVFYHNIGES